MNCWQRVTVRKEQEKCVVDYEGPEQKRRLGEKRRQLRELLVSF